MDATQSSAATQRSIADPIPELPSLEPGLHLLEFGSIRESTGASPELALHAIAVDRVLLSGGTACWIDPGRYARSGPLVELTSSAVDLAPSDRILDRITVARGFTPFQHLALLDSLPGTVDDRTALVVVPDLDGYYRGDELSTDEGREMLLSGVAVLNRLARERGLPVVVTRRVDDRFARPIGTAADRRLRCEATRFGPRFVTDDGAGSLVYPIDGGNAVQTTLSFWERVLTARTPLYGSSPAIATTEVTADGAH